MEKEIINEIKKQIENIKIEENQSSFGIVTEVFDGIVKAKGLTDVKISEMLTFQNGETGLVLNLEEESVGIIVLGDAKNIHEGDKIERTQKILEIGVSNDLLGRIINPIGEAIDGGAQIKSKTFYPIEKVAPGVMSRQSVSEPMQTGIKAIDALIPIGRGQRELIIGDRQTGKTAIAIDIILNQKDQGVTCIYVSIGQKDSKLRKIEQQLRVQQHRPLLHISF